MEAETEMEMEWCYGSEEGDGAQGEADFGNPDMPPGLVSPRAQGLVTSL